MIFAPYYAWASELSINYNERTLITGWRTATGLVATASAQAIPTIALIYFGFGGTPAVVTMMGVMMLLLLPITIGLTMIYVPDPNKVPPSRVFIRQGLRLMMRNGPFKRLLAAFFFTHIGVAISATLFIFYVRSVLGAESAGIEILFVNYVANLAGIPFWIWVSKKIGKHRAWCAAMVLFVCANPFYFLLDVGDVFWMIPIVAVTGFSLGASATLSNSMKADVIDLDTLMSGENRAGLFFATWSMVLKLALAVGPAIVLWILAGAGLEAAPGLIEVPDQRQFLQWLFILSSPLCNGIAALMVWRYPITEARHQRLRMALERRNARRLARSE